MDFLGQLSIQCGKRPLGGSTAIQLSECCFRNAMRVPAVHSDRVARIVPKFNAEYLK